MAVIVDYASLKQAVTDWAHRGDLATGNYIDYFIQSALEQIQNDIPDLNFGNFIQPMEVAYPPSAITGGSIPVPTDYVAPKVFYINDMGGDVFTLKWKSATWLNDQIYSVRQPEGLPAFIARDIIAPANFTASLSNTGVLTVSALSGSNPLQTGMIIGDAGVHLPATGPGTAIMITGQTSGVNGGTGVYTAASCAPIATATPTVSSESMTGGGGVFVFGPWPDAAYQVYGTYYQQIPALSSGNTTNWVVLQAPTMLHACCMMEAAKFLKDPGMYALWNKEYQPRLKALVDRDKAERWSAATLQVDVA